MPLNHVLEELQRPHDVLILCTGDNEFIQSDDSISVLVHLLKESVHVLFWCVCLQRRIGEAAHHVIYGFHNIHHLLFVNVSISVDVVQVEGPLQLLCCGSSQ